MKLNRVKTQHFLEASQGEPGDVHIILTCGPGPTVQHKGEMVPPAVALDQLLAQAKARRKTGVAAIQDAEAAHGALVDDLFARLAVAVEPLAGELLALLGLQNDLARLSASFSKTPQ